MTSYELVRRAIEFQRPERIPICFEALGIDDVVWADLAPASAWTPIIAGADEWGGRWEQPPAESGIVNMGQVKGHSLASLDHLDEFPWPDPRDDGRYAPVEAVLGASEDKYVIARLGFCLFERMHVLYGMENLFIAFHERPDRVHELAERVLEFQVGIARELGRRFPGRVHGYRTTDDWGTQLSPFIQLPMWREFFKERYRRMFAAFHEAGIHVWMHSCGHINDVIEEWIECGVDTINLQQPRNLGIEEIGGRYRGRVCFCSLCDIQATLPFGTEQQIREEARLLLEHWATPEGGFILTDYTHGEYIGVSLESKRVMLNEFIRRGAPSVTIPA